MTNYPIIRQCFFSTCGRRIDPNKIIFVLGFAVFTLDEPFVAFIDEIRSYIHD